MRDLRVRTKLAAVLTIPLIGFLVVTGLQVASSVRSAIELDELSERVAVSREVTSLIHELQRERDRTAGMLAAIGGRQPAARNFSELAPEHTAVDRAVSAYTEAAQSLGRDQRSAEIEVGLASLARIRDGARTGWLSRQAVFDAYTRIIASLETLVAVPPGAGGDPDLAQAVGAFANASRVKELAAQIRGRLYAVCSAGVLAPGEFEAVSDVRAQREAAIDRLRSDADPAQLTAYDELVSGQAVRNASRLEQTVVDNARAGAPAVDAQQWWLASTTTLEQMRQAETRLLDDAVRAAEARTAAQWRTTALSSLGSIVLLLLALLLSMAIGRTMIDTLHSLREQAHDVARHRLPQVIEALRGSRRGVPAITVEPVAIRSADEIGEVAEAFTAVHRSAVRLAVEQALMRQNVDSIFVNLARRSQTLVERQLRLLDTLEASETDPDQLTNLFRLDHLATRMRRNDDNLLVLAGGEASRRWAEPVPLATIALAAMAEIEQYTRVKHDITDDVHIVGHAVADVVHLVAELLDNATVFSPPDSTVTVLGWAADPGAALVIEDEGIGMSPEAVAAANRQLANPVSLDSATAERMGLVVVGHLAHRHGIRVELRSGRKGVIAHLALPVQLLADPPEAAPVESDPARWLRTERPSLVLAGAERSGDDEAGPPAPTAAPSSRPTPMRAEDVLGVGRPDGRSVWWSRGGTATTTGAKPTAPPTPSPRPTTNGAGLPVRVPMAHLPLSQPASVGQPHSEPANVGRPPEEPDPHEVHGVLSRFYGGVHRAAAEDDAQQRIT